MPAAGFTEHTWVNVSLLKCDLGHRVQGNRTAVPGHLGTALVGPALQGNPWALSSVWSSEYELLLPDKGELLYLRANGCYHCQGVLTPSSSRVLHAQMWMHTLTHFCPHAHRANALLWPWLLFCSAFLPGCSAGCRQPRSGEKLSSWVCCVWESLLHSAPWCGSACTTQVRAFLISNLLVSQEVQVNVGLAEGLQDTSDFDMGSQSNSVRIMHTVAVEALRERGAGRESPHLLPYPTPSTAGRAMDWVLPSSSSTSTALQGLHGMSCAQL